MYKSQTSSLLVTINNNYIKSEDINILDSGAYAKDIIISTPENIVKTLTIS
ncbi:MAG TPA: hypothetical protein PLC53_00845 [Bacilli bacterium]|nr:hypothetical protein [Bacilli bacterium]